MIYYDQYPVSITSDNLLHLSLYNIFLNNYVLAYDKIFRFCYIRKNILFLVLYFITFALKRQ